MRTLLTRAASRVPWDARLASVLFVLGAALGMVYVSTCGGRPSFLQHMFGPAVMWVCGRGFENPMLSKAPALEDFLYGRRDSFSPEDLPEDLPVAPADPLELTPEQWKKYHPHPDFGGWVNCQRFHLYFLMTVALFWKALGISWSALTPLYGILYGAASAAAYGLFRLAMRRRLATVFAVLFVLAPLHLQHLPDMRDYAKAPFFLAAILIMGHVARRPWPTRPLLGLSAACGILLGFGLGFRQDLLICVPAFVVVALVFMPGKLKETVRARLAATAVFLACFLLFGGPILHVLFFRANNSSHDTLIGTLGYCDRRLGVGSKVYDLGDPFLDEYTRAVVEGYNDRANGGRQPLSHYTAEYDEASSQYLRLLATTFPADFVVRAYASVLRIVDEMRVHPSNPAPRGLTHPLVVGFYRAYGAAMRVVLGYGRYCVAAVLLLIAGRRGVRAALCALFLLCWFAGYPALRFNLRHCFHLHVVSLWAAGCLLQQVLEGASALFTKAGRARWRENGGDARAWLPGFVRNAAGFGLVAAVGLTAPLLVLRWYQHKPVAALLRAYENAQRETLQTTSALCDDGERVLWTPQDFARMDRVPVERKDLPIQTEYLVVEIAGTGRAVSLVFLYEAEDPLRDFTRAVDVPLPDAGGAGPPVTRVFFPVYYAPWSRFKGFTVSKHDTDLVTAVYRVRDWTDLPLLLNANLYPHWERLPLHYAMTR